MTCSLDVTGDDAETQRSWAACQREQHSVNVRAGIWTFLSVARLLRVCGQHPGWLLGLNSVGVLLTGVEMQGVRLSMRVSPPKWIILCLDCPCFWLTQEVITNHSRRFCTLSVTMLAFLRGKVEDDGNMCDETGLCCQLKDEGTRIPGCPTAALSSHGNPGSLRKQTF